jgi:hypothetical protein
LSNVPCSSPHNWQTKTKIIFSTQRRKDVNQGAKKTFTVYFS